MDIGFTITCSCGNTLEMDMGADGVSKRERKPLRSEISSEKTITALLRYFSDGDADPIGDDWALWAEWGHIIVQCNICDVRYEIHV